MTRILFFFAIFIGLVANISAQTFIVNGINYNVVSAVNPYTVEVIAKNPIYTGAITIPATVTNGGITYSVIRIGQQAYQNCTTVTSVTMPNSVKDIGTSAFAGCSALTTVVFPNALTNILGYAFTNCSSLASISLPSTLQLINNYAFRGCTSLTTVTIPATVTTLGISPFAGCAKLTSFTVAGSNPNYKAVNGAILSINGATLVQTPAGLTNFEVPNGVTTLANNSFMECSKLQELFMPNSLTTIGESAFSNCTVLDTIYCNATTAPLVANANAFTNVPSNAVIFVPTASVNAYKAASHWIGFANILAIPSMAVKSTFVYNGLKYAVLTDVAPYTVEVNANTTKYEGDIVIPEQVRFNYQSYAVTKIGRWAFSNCFSLTSVKMPNTVQEIDDYGFMQCIGLHTAELSTSLQRIGTAAFMRCYELGNVTLPATLKEIGEWSFNDCNEMTALTIPKSATMLGAAAFSCNEKMHDLVLESGNTKYKQVDGAIFNMAGDTLMYVSAKVTSYTIPPTVKFIDNAAFGGCSLLTSMIIPSTVQNVGSHIFEDCIGLLEATIPSTITKIPQGMFVFCNNLTTVHLPDNLTEIGGLTFYTCTSLKTISIPSGVTTIGHQAFYYSGLTSLYIYASTPPALVNTAFDNVSRSIPIYVPIGSEAAYKAAPNWSVFTNYNPTLTSTTNPSQREVIVRNPIVSVLKIDNLESGTQVELYNVNGALLMKQTVDNSVFEYNTQTLSNGIYIVRINQNGTIKSYKIVKK